MEGESAMPNIRLLCQVDNSSRDDTVSTRRGCCYPQHKLSKLADVFDFVI